MPTTLENNEHLHDVHHACTHANDCDASFSHIHADKSQTISDRIMQAKTVSQKKGLRFTKLREQVYELILQADKPIGAYDLINAMQLQENQRFLATDTDSKSHSHKGKNIAPPTVYRSLEFLLDAGFIHQLTSINAFVPCCHPRGYHIAGFLICNHCQRVQECSNDAVQRLINHTNEEVGFSVEKTVIEMTGICQSCQHKSINAAFKK